ncbi:hypothetical protein MNBD_GAMMA22-956 [hydrothermal vent metagenome]|uniref:Uncharacterized protein n=1 Tax=hydrothermal vent metagenome TaxID=652676 RepID=A0A3B1B732_9ZZZZ
MKRLSKQLEVVLDKICHQGCTYVRQCIIKLKNDELVNEANSINIDEQQIILQELVSIMEIYDMQQNN